MPAAAGRYNQIPPNSECQGWRPQRYQHMRGHLALVRRYGLLPHSYYARAIGHFAQNESVRVRAFHLPILSPA
jgi:hypothetical protein